MRLISANSCGPQSTGSLYRIGYSIPTVEQFATVIFVCLNTATDSTYYANHTIFKGNSGNGMTANEYNWDSTGLDGILTVPFLRRKYLKESQRQYFKNIFGYIPDDFLAKGHLTPNADEPFHSWTKATYFYLNHVPQWQKLNQGVWIKVENVVRQLSNNNDITIYTGGHGQYSVNGQILYIVHENQRVVVPKFIWKLIILPNESIAFVIMNTKTDTERDRIMCFDRDHICEKLRFNEYINEFKAGFLSCCSEESLYRMIGYRLR